MTTLLVRSLFRHPAKLLPFGPGLALGVASLLPGAASAQSAAQWLASAPAPSHALLLGAEFPTTPGFSSSLAPEAPLPEAPLPQIAVDPKPKPGTDPSQHIAEKNAMSIPSDWHAQRLTAHEKVVAGTKDLYSVESIGAWFLSAGYEQIANNAPNYGTDKGAFGERLGAAALRGTSQNVFTEIILAPVLHEDDRYYVEGPQYNFFHRTVYAVTRPFITRTDEGKETVNGALLIGYAGAAALTPAYYPSVNRTFRDVAGVYGGGIGGAALGFFISEFSQDALRALHLNKHP